MTVLLSYADNGDVEVTVPYILYHRIYFTCPI
jgi:hypothetical protein